MSTLASLVLARTGWLIASALGWAFALLESGLSNTATLLLSPVLTFLAVVVPIYLKTRYDRWQLEKNNATHTSDTMVSTAGRVAELSLDERKWLREQSDELFQRAELFWQVRDEQRQKLIDAQQETLKSQETLLKMLEGTIAQLHRVSPGSST